MVRNIYGRQNQVQGRPRLLIATRNPSNFWFIMALLKATVLSGKFNAAYSIVDNSLADLPMLGDEELESGG